MSWYIRPEEIVAEIRKLYPTEKVIGPPERPVAPRVSLANEYLYGAVIYVYGEGVKGQYLRHGYFEREGRRYWAIEYGWVTLYGVTQDGKVLPLVVLGIPTRLVFEYKPRDFRSFKLEEVPLGYLECLESQIINLERVMRGEDPIMIIDKYDLLRTSDGRPTPAEMIDRIVEMRQIIETQQRAIWEYEKTISDYKANIAMLQSRVAKLLELLRSYEERNIKLASEVTAVQQELIRLREEVLVKVTETEALEETRKRLRDVIDRISDMLKDLMEWVSSLQKAVELRKEEVKGGKK